MGPPQWQVGPFQLSFPLAQAQTSIVTPLVKISQHKSSLITGKLFTQFKHIVHNLPLTMDFSNLWKHCYRFTHTFFHTV